MTPFFLSLSFSGFGLVVVGTVRLHRPQKETWRTNEMRVYRARIFEIRDPQSRAGYRQPARRSEKSAMRIPTIAPLFSSENRPDGYTRLCNRLPSGSL
jgi:hypothetical protein